MQKIDEQILYKNPIPHLKSRQAKFPGLVRLPRGDLLALYEVGEAFDSMDSRMHISRSTDNGRSWEYQGPMFSSPDIGGRTDGTVKPVLLSDGSLLAMGYRYDRDDPETELCNPETGGLRPGDLITSFSRDNGRSWTVPETVDIGIPELLEVSGPPVLLASGELLAGGAVFTGWDGGNPSGKRGILIESGDQGKTWKVRSHYFYMDGKKVSPFESRFCLMGNSSETILSLVWAYDEDNNEHLTNHFTLSRDGGRSWSDPMDTGIRGQASNAVWLKDDLFLTVHAHRADVKNGLWVRMVRIREDAGKVRWEVLEEKPVWGTEIAMSGEKKLSAQFASLKFGQPSLIPLSSANPPGDDPELEVLAVHWCVEDCQSIIKTHRLRINC